MWFQRKILNFRLSVLQQTFILHFIRKYVFSLHSNSHMYIRLVSDRSAASTDTKEFINHFLIVVSHNIACGICQTSQYVRIIIG